MEHEDKREAILKAAEEMVQNRRFHEVTLDEVAQAARVSKGTIYNYFEDKEDLFFQLATHGHDQLCDAVRDCAASQTPTSFQERLEQVCTRISEFFQSRHALMRVMGDQESRIRALHHKHRQVFKQHRGRLRAAVAKVLAVGIPDGQVRTDVPLEVLAEFLMGLMATRGRAFHDQEQPPSISLLVDIFLHGVRGEGE